MPPTSREIERKFLIKEVPPGLQKHTHKTIDQGYLAADRKGTQVRLRRAGKQFFLTYKRGTGLTREEREVRLTRTQFEKLWPGTKGHRLTKTRYDVPLNDCIVEVDVYQGKNSGLLVAEVEFESEKACKAFKPPAWFGKEVSGEGRYSNVKLARE
jgi:adenylate cyclase